MSDSVSQFFAAWGIADDAARNAQIAGALGETILYADPRTPLALTSVQAVQDYVGQFTHSAPGWPVEALQLSTTLAYRLTAVRFGAGDQAQWGQYVADLDGLGKIIRLVGFVGSGPIA